MMDEMFLDTYEAFLYEYKLIDNIWYSKKGDYCGDLGRWAGDKIIIKYRI